MTADELSSRPDSTVENYLWEHIPLWENGPVTAVVTCRACGLQATVPGNISPLRLVDWTMEHEKVCPVRSSTLEVAR